MDQFSFTESVSCRALVFYLGGAGVGVGRFHDLDPLLVSPYQSVSSGHWQRNQIHFCVRAAAQTKDGVRGAYR